MMPAARTGSAWPQHASVGTVGIVVALREEWRGIRRRIRSPRGFGVGRFRLVRGRLGTAPVIAVRTGEGRQNARDGARVLLDQGPVTELIVAGFAGAVTTDLEAGALVVASRVVDGGLDVPAPSGGWPRRTGLVPPLTATVVTTDRMLCTPHSKRAALEGIAHGGPVVVDLETAAVAAVAHQRGTPYRVVRVVSDALDESLPLDFNRFVDSSGRLDRLGIVGHAALRPALIPALWRLRRRSVRDSESLARAVCALIEGGRP
jgi:adenosylhomocysteine nucleosidase